MKEEPTAKRRPSFATRLLAFFLTVALVLGGVALVAYRDHLNFDAFKRWFTYRSLERSDSGQAESFRYEGRYSDLFSDLNGDLLIASPSAARLYSAGGVEYLSLPCQLKQPGLSSRDGLAVVYDVGGSNLLGVQDRQEAFSLSLDSSKQLLSANLSENGWLAVTTKETGYKGVVTLYHGSADPVIALRISSRFLTDAVPSSDGKNLAVLAVGLEENTFASTLLLYPTDGSQEPFAQCSLGNDVILSLHYADGYYWTLGETSLSIVGEDGALAGQFDYSDQSLKSASLGGDGFATLLLGKYRAGSAAELVTVDQQGQSLGRLSIQEQVLSLSAAGRYVAVLTADQLDIYTKDFTLYDCLTGTQGARQVVLREDGSAFLIGSESARLYVPN